MPHTRRTLAQHLAPYAKSPQPKREKDNTWIVEGLLRKGEITLLVGRPKDGKTCLAATLATAIARGSEFATIPTQKTNVLYLAAEESPREWSLALHPYLTTVCPKRLLIVFHPLSIDRPAHLDLLKAAIEKHHIGLLVVDPLLAALHVSDLSGFPAARSALLRLGKLCRETNVAALVLHHAHERNERAVRIQGHPILALSVHRTFILNHRPQGQGRLLTLRGEPTLRFASLNPGHYESTTHCQKQCLSAQK